MYSIIELQTTNEQTTHLYQNATTKNEAMNKFHSVLAFAATSNIEIHTCIVIDEEGKLLARESYHHYVENEVEE